MTQEAPAEEQGKPYPNYIRYYLKQQGYSIQELADRTGISRRSLTDYLGGVRAVPRTNLKKIARVLRCSIHELVPEPDLVPRDKRLVLHQRRGPGKDAERVKALVCAQVEASPAALELFEVGVVALALAYQQQQWSSAEFQAHFEEVRRRIIEMAHYHAGDDQLT